MLLQKVKYISIIAQSGEWPSTGVEQAFSRQRRLSSRRVRARMPKTCPLDSGHGRLEGRSTHASQASIYNTNYMETGLPMRLNTLFVFLALFTGLLGAQESTG